MLYFIYGLMLYACLACVKLPDPPPDLDLGPYASGVFVVNEGVFGQTSGTLSFRSAQTGEVEQEVYRRLNGRDLGNVFQSMVLDSQHLYLVLNNSGWIVALNRGDLLESGRLEGLRQPRYMAILPSGSEAVLTEWGQDGLTGALVWLGLPNLNFIQRLDLGGRGSEAVVADGDKIWVALSGGYGRDNRLALVDGVSRSLRAYWDLPAENPVGLYLERERNRLWVLCRGETQYTVYPRVDSLRSSPAALLALDAETGLVLERWLMPLGFGARALTCGDGFCYWLHGSCLYVLPWSGGVEPRCLVSGDFYGLAYRSPSVLYAGRYQGIERAWALRYDAVSAEVLDSFRVGVFPNGFVFTD